MLDQVDTEALSAGITLILWKIPLFSDPGRTREVMGLDTLWVAGDQFLGPGPRSPLALFPIEEQTTPKSLLGCVGGIVAVGLGLVLAYRLSVRIPTSRREFQPVLKRSDAHLSWKQVKEAALLPTRVGSSMLPWLQGSSASPSPTHAPFLLHPHPRPVPPLQAYPGSSAHFHQFLGVPAEVSRLAS